MGAKVVPIKEDYTVSTIFSRLFANDALRRLDRATHSDCSS